FCRSPDCSTASATRIWPEICPRRSSGRARSWPMRARSRSRRRRRPEGAPLSIASENRALHGAPGCQVIHVVNEYHSSRECISAIVMAQKKLSSAQRSELLDTLRARFEKNKARHKGLEWAHIQEKLEAH